MNEIIYIPEKRHFKIYRRSPYSCKIGFFFFTRFLYGLDCDGKQWQENIFCVFVGLMSFFTVPADLVCVACFYVLKGFYKIILYFIKIVFNNLLGTFLKIATTLLTILILWLKWQEIMDFIKNLF